VQRSFDGTGNFLAHHAAHAAADEGKVHDRKTKLAAVDLADAADDGVVTAGLLTGFDNAIGITLRVLELQRIERYQFSIELDKAVFVQQDIDVVGRADAEVIAALAADPQVLFQLADVDDFATGIALRPGAVGNFL